LDAVSTDAAANGLDTNVELFGNGSQANSADFVGGADGRAPRGMDCRPTDRLAALGTLGLSPRHASKRPSSRHDAALSESAARAISGKRPVQVMPVTGEKPHATNVACDGNGLPVFDRLRYRRQDGHVFLYGFDLIELDGKDLRREPIERRRVLLIRLLAKSR
jgi:hypothetical protein